MKLSEIKEQHRYTHKLNPYYSKFVIYKLHFSNGKIYIGQTKNLKRRLYNYINKTEHKGHFVKKAILKYGLNNVDLEIIKICRCYKDLNKAEIYYINFYDSCNLLKGYNLDLGGKSGKPSSQTILKKIQSSKKIKVGQYDLQGNLIKVFNSVKEASRTLKINDSDIHRCCKTNGVRNGFLFSKTLFEKIKPLDYKKKHGQWNLKMYKIVNIINSDVVVIEGLENVSEYLKCSKKYLNNILRRKTIYKKQFKIEKYES